MSLNQPLCTTTTCEGNKDNVCTRSIAYACSDRTPANQKLAKKVEKPSTVVCSCCGQMRTYPTQAGLWEYLENPIFNPDGTLDTEYQTTVLVSYENGQSVNPPRVETAVHQRDQKWQQVSVVGMGDIGGEGSFRLVIVPVGKKTAIWWPARAIWRKVGDQPLVKPEEIYVRG